jgi:hypothetical protein
MGIELQGAGGGAAGGPIELQGFAGSHTRPARPPEASSAGPPEAHNFGGGGRNKEEPPVYSLWSLKSVLDFHFGCLQPGPEHGISAPST